MTSESEPKPAVTKKCYSIEMFQDIQSLYDVLHLAQGMFLAYTFSSECFFQHRQNRDMAKLRSMVDNFFSLASLRFGSQGIFCCLIAILPNWFLLGVIKIDDNIVKSVCSLTVVHTQSNLIPNRSLLRFMRFKIVQYWMQKILSSEYSLSNIDNKYKVAFEQHQITMPDIMQINAKRLLTWHGAVDRLFLDGPPDEQVRF